VSPTSFVRFVPARAFGAGVFGALVAGAAGAQAPAGPRTPAAPAAPAAVPPALSLADALRTALDLNPALRAARQQVRAGRGALAAAEAPFDPRVRTALASNRTSDLAFAPVADGGALAATPVVATRQRALDYSVSVEKQFRFGAVLAPEVGISQVGVVGLGVAPANRARAGVNLLLPLARNRQGGVVEAGRRAAAAGFDAASADLHQTVAQTAYEAAAAYWDYAAASERLAAYRDSEARARVLVEETAELVRGDARPRADLRQFTDNLATKRAQRLAAEQTEAEARRRLGVVLGLPAAQIGLLPPARLAAGDAATPRAAVTPGDAGRDTERHTATWAAAASADALARRPDVRAAAARRASAAHRVDAAHSALRPRLDLTVGMSYAGLTRGAGFDGLVSPLGAGMAGGVATLQLQYELPARNLLARGQADQAEAALEQARVAERDLARQIEAAVAVAAAGVERGRLALAEADSAVRIAREVVDNEKQKFRLGVSTQIDVIYAEDALTSALLAEVGARAAYAAAVGALRFQSGDLAAAGEDPAALAGLLTRDPTPPAAPRSAP